MAQVSDFRFGDSGERLGLSTDLGAIITVLTREDLGVLLGHIKSRGRPWQGSLGPFHLTLTTLLVQAPKWGMNIDPEGLKLQPVLTVNWAPVEA